MAINREFTSEELEDGEKIHEGERVDFGTWRHGHSEAIVFEVDGKHWKAWFDVHPTEGMDINYPVSATQVEQKEVMVTKWIEVKNEAV